MKKNPKFQIPEPKAQIGEAVKLISKYRVGDPNFTFREIFELKPIFAFDYISLNNAQYCFNEAGLKADDYVGFIAGLKKVSSFSYKDLRENDSFRFHEIDFNDKRVSISRNDFKKVLSHKLELLPDEQMPTLYQFDIQYVGKARVCGFLFKGVFYLVWYDRHHKIYPRK